MDFIKKYDINTSSIKIAELFEIANKYQLYQKSTKNKFLKIIYKLALFLAKFLALAEQENKKGDKTPF